MTDIDVNTLLIQMRSMAQRVNAGQVEAQVGPPKSNFSTLFDSAVNEVNTAQQSASALAESFERGTPGVDLAEVMIASQKASLSFQAITRVRNRLVAAYQEVMNMPI